MRHRVLNWLYARWHAYYWVPCPICGQMYGGHEAKGGTLWTHGGGGQAVCPDCADAPALHRANIERFEHGMICDAPVLEGEPTDYRQAIYSRRPGAALCPSCQSTLDFEKQRLAALEAVDR